jgi:hypothetical protein
MFSEDNKGDAVEGVADLHVDPAETGGPAEEQDAPATGEAQAERADRCPAVTRSGRACYTPGTYPDGHCVIHSKSNEAAVARQLGRVRGGSVARRAGPSGLTPAAVEDLALGTADGQLGLLEAVAKGVATNAITAAQANALAAIVKVAQSIVATDQAEQIAELERRVAQIVIEQPRSRR